MILGLEKEINVESGVRTLPLLNNRILSLHNGVFKFKIDTYLSDLELLSMINDDEKKIIYTPVAEGNLTPQIDSLLEDFTLAYDTKEGFFAFRKTLGIIHGLLIGNNAGGLYTMQHIEASERARLEMLRIYDVISNNSYFTSK